jgi:hypothetical protein
MDVRLLYRAKVEARRSWSLTPGIDRNIRITDLATEGRRVAEGEVVVRYEVPGLDEDVNRVEQKLSRVLAAFRNAEVEFSIERSSVVWEMENDRRVWKEARFELARYVEAKRNLARRRDTVRVEDAGQRRDRARHVLARLPDFLAQGFASDDELVRAQNELRRAEQALERAKGDLALHETYDEPMTLARLRSREKMAHAAFAAKKTFRQARLTGRERSLRYRQDGIRELIKRRKELLAIGANPVILAPTSGIVVYGDGRSRRRRRHRAPDLNVGSEVWGQTVIVTLPSLEGVCLTLDVPQDKVYLLTRGMQVRIRADRRSPECTGEVVHVAELAKATGRRSNESRRMFEVQIDPNDPEAFLPNRTVEVEIHVATLRGVLYVPIHAVYRERGRTYCRVRRGGGEVPVEVETGRRGEHFCEIRSGLSVGDLIFLGKPELGEPRD